MKRIFLILSCVLLLMNAFTFVIFADSPEDGTLNSTALNYFTGIVDKLPANTDYVIYKSGDYTTNLIYGALTLNGSIIRGSDVKKLTYNQRGKSDGNTGYGASYYPTFDQEEISDYTLSFSSSSILYSNLGDFSAVGETQKDTNIYILWSVIFLIFLFVVYKHFRNRRQYINL